MYRDSSVKLISNDGKTAVTRSHIISNIHFNAPSQTLKKAGNITYRQLSEEDVGLMKESLPDNNNIESISPDGTLVGDYHIWHKDAEQGWQKEEVRGYIKVFNMAGNIAGGVYFYPTVWIKDSQNQWQAKRLDNRNGGVWNLNSDSSIAVGFINPQEDGSEISEDRRVPILWTGENWEKVIDLAESINNLERDLYNDAFAINAKGNIVGGRVNDKPIIWSGDNWQEITWLGDRGSVFSLNAQGDIAAGELNRIPTIWSGEKWQTVTPLAPEKETGQVVSLSADGTVATGYMENSKGQDIPTLWRISYSQVLDEAATQEALPEFRYKVPDTAPQENALPIGVVPEEPVLPPVVTPEKPAEQPTAQPAQPAEPAVVPPAVIPAEQPAQPTAKPATKPAEQPNVVAMIDVANTQKAMLAMGQDTFELLSLQYAALRRLQEECVAGKGELCYALQHDYAGQNGNYDNALGLRLGYGVSDNFTLGVNFDRSLKRGLPESYRRLNNNGGAGLFAHYKLPHSGYFAAGISKDYYHAQTQRALLANTEFAPTRSRINGLAWNITLGQDFRLDNNGQLGWYAAYRQTEVTRDGYRENVPGFPVEYGKAALKDNTVALGAKLALPIAPKLTWVNRVEFERRVGGQSPIYSAKADYVGDFRYQQKLNQNRWLAQTGLSYAFAPSFNVSFTPYVSNGIIGHKQWGTKLAFEGRF